jgi:hypothetical protein
MNEIKKTIQDIKTEICKDMETQKNPQYPKQKYQ